MQFPKSSLSPIHLDGKTIFMCFVVKNNIYVRIFNLRMKENNITFLCIYICCRYELQSIVKLVLEYISQYCISWI